MLNRYYHKVWVLSLMILMAGSPMAATLNFTVPVKKQVRILISSDAKNEADDDFAVVHALLTPSFQVKALLGAQFSRTAPIMKRESQQTATESANELKQIVQRMGMHVPVMTGAQTSLSAKPDTSLSPAAQAIIAEAHKPHQPPLFVLVLGPLTDLALAYQKDPTIAQHMTAIWVGGMPYPKGGWEYNLFNDPKAAQIVLNSTIPLWQIPHNVYMTMRVSMAELQMKVRTQGKLGRYLWDQMIAFDTYANNNLPFNNWPKSEVWVLGDNSSIGVLLATEAYQYSEHDAPLLDKDLNYLPNPNSKRKIRVYHKGDARLVFGDFFSKLALFHLSRTSGNTYP